MGRLERGESGVTVDSLVAILAKLDVSLKEFFKRFNDVVRLSVGRTVAQHSQVESSRPMRCSRWRSQRSSSRSAPSIRRRNPQGILSMRTR
jgi:hypothetical protein